MDGETPSEPDSTTAEKEVAVREFAVNDDVLCQISRKDHQLYLGVVVQVNRVLKKCLVKFLDNTETWCCFADMKFFSVGEQNVTCVVCKSSQPSLGNKLHVCACGRGYHQLCHQPHIPGRDPDWKCRICSPIRRRDVSEVVPKHPSHAPSTLQQSLEQQQTCQVCEVKDPWFRGMLQCRRCKQWMHGRCISSLKTPLLNGDRFYVMVCAGCNLGREMCCRLALTWPDLVHLTLFNLNLVHHSKFHDLDDVIMPFLHGVWNTLQLPPEMANTPLDKRRYFVESALQNTTKRFRCGREAKKRVTLWGLRMRGAPRPPSVNLPSRGPVEEDLFINRKSVLLPIEPPLQNGHVNSSRKEDERGRQGTDKSGSSTPTDILPTDEKVESSTEFHGRGLVKRSVPFPLTEATNNADTRFYSNAVRRAARLLRKRNRKPKCETPVIARLSDSEDEALRTLFRKSSRPISKYLSKREDKGNKKEVRKRPQRNLLEARLNSTESKLYNPQAAAANSTPPAESPSKKKLKKGDERKSVGLRIKPKRKLVQKTIFETLQARSSRPDGADGDTNSSSDERVLPLKTVITKRQLSEKDIVVDRNGVVRRRRRHHRRPSGLLLPPKPVPQPLPTPRTTVNLAELFDAPVDMALVKELLGPFARIERGESYRVMSKRILKDGTEEILIDFPNSIPS